MAWVAGARSQPNDEESVREAFRQLGASTEDIDHYMAVTRGEDDQDEASSLYPVYPANWLAVTVFLRVCAYMERHPVNGQPLALKDGPVWRIIDRLQHGGRVPDIDEFELFDRVMTIGRGAVDEISGRYYQGD